MHTATAAQLNPAVSIDEGLTALRQAFADQSIEVASIALYRQNEPVRHLTFETAPGVQRTLEGVYTDHKIVVSVVSPMPPDVNATLQAATTSAAAAAPAWIASEPQPTIFSGSQTMRLLDAAVPRVARSNHIVLITGESGTGKTTA